MRHVNMFMLEVILKWRGQSTKYIFKFCLNLEGPRMPLSWARFVLTPVYRGHPRISPITQYIYIERERA